MSVISPELLSLILTIGLPVLAGFALRHFGGNLGPILSAILRALAGGQPTPNPLVPTPPAPTPGPLLPSPLLPSLPTPGGGAIRDMLLAAAQELLRKLLAGEQLTAEETRALDQFKGFQTLLPPQQQK